MVNMPGKMGLELASRSRISSLLCAGLLIAGALTAHAQTPALVEPARIAVSVDTPRAALSAGASTDFVVTVGNSGGAATSGERIVMAMPSGLRSLSWTCSAHGGSRCAAISGTGPLDAPLSGLLANSSLEFAFHVVADAAPPAFIDIATQVSLAATDRCETGESAPCRAFLRIPTGPNVTLDVSSSAIALAPGQQVQYIVTARTTAPTSSTSGTVLRSPVPNGLIESRWTCRSSVGACTATAGSGPIEQVTGDFSRGDIEFQISAKVAANPPATIVQSVVALPPYGGSCAEQGGGNGYRTAPCTARKELSSKARILVSRSEGYRGTADSVSTRFVLENVGSRADGSRVSAPIPPNATVINWTCTAQGAQCPQISGTGPIAQTIASWPSSGKLIYDLTITSPSATTKDLMAVMQVMPSADASCGRNGTPPPCSAPQPLRLENSGLRLQQRVDRLGAGRGELVGYVVSVGSDASASASHDVVLSVPLPDGIDAIVSWTCVAGSSSATGCPVRSGKGAIRQLFPVLSASSDLKYFLQARVGAAAPAKVIGRATLTAPVAASLGCPGRDGVISGCVATSEFSTVPVFALEQSILADILSPGSPVDYVLDVFNLGAKTDAVRIRNWLPAGVANVSWTCSGLGMDCPASNGSGSVFSTLQQMPAGAGVRYQVAATVGNTSSLNASSVLTATPSAAGRCHKDAAHDSSAAPCTDRTDSSFASKLELSQAATERQLLRGGVVHHSVTLMNHGAATDGTKLSMPLAAGIEYSSWTCAGFGGAVCPQDSGSGAIDETIPTLPFNASLTYSIQSELAEDARTQVSIDASVAPAGAAQCVNGNCADTLALPVTEVPSAHLQIAIGSSQTTAPAGSTGTWTIDVRNLGSEIAGPFSLVDSLPANSITVLRWTCAGVECPAASGTGPIEQVIRSLSIHDSSSSEESVMPGRIVFTVDGKVPNTVGSNAELVVAIQPSAGDTCAPVNCQGKFELPDGFTETLNLQLNTEQSVVDPNGTVNYFFNILNFSSTSITNLPVYSISPAGFTSSTWTCEGEGVVCPPPGSGEINAVVSLASNQSVTFFVTAQTAGTLPPTLDYVAGVTASSPTICAPASCEVTSSLPSAAQLQLSLTADTSVVRPDDTIEYTYSIANVGGTEEFGFFPASVNSPDFISSSWTCVGTGGASCTAAGSGPIDDFVELVPPGGVVTYSISATVGSDLQSNIVMLASVEGPDGASLYCIPASCSTSLSLPSGSALPARMSISKTANRTDLFAGGGVRYTVSVANIGSELASSIQLVDDVPDGLTAFYWTCAATGDVSCEEASGSGPLNQFLSFMAPGSRLIYTVDADVADDASGVISNVAQLSGDNIECEPTGCVATRSLPVRVPTDVVVSKSVNPASGASVTVNGPIVWTLRATNDGGATTGILTLADTLPTGVKNIVVGVENGVTCSPAQPNPGDALICTIPAGFQGDRKVTISATVSSSPGMVISNTVRGATVNGQVTCTDCTVSNPVTGSFDLAVLNPRPFSAGGIDGTLVDVVNLSETPVSGASLSVTPATSLRLLSPFSAACTATVGDGGNVSVVCPNPPSTQGMSCVGNTCTLGELSQNMATTIFVALNAGTAATLQVGTIGDTNPSNNSIELPAGGTP